MANYGGARFTRPLMNDRYIGSPGGPAGERPGLRFNTPPNRNGQRNNFNDNRPQMNKPNDMQQQRSVNPTKPNPEANKPTTTTATTTAAPAVATTTAANTSTPPTPSNSAASAAAAPSTVARNPTGGSAVVKHDHRDLLMNSPNKTTTPTKVAPEGVPAPSTASEPAPYLALQPSSTLLVEKKSSLKPDNPTPAKQHDPTQQQQQRASGQKRPRPAQDYQQQHGSIASASSSATSNPFDSSSTGERKALQSGRCRLFIGNVPSDLTQEEFQVLFGKYGELVEYFVNPSRGFGFVKLSSRQLAEQAKIDLDGYVLRGKPLRIRFASQGATVKVKNLTPNVSNEQLKEAFEQHFGGVERAVVIVDDRGKSTGEGIIEFEKKPSAQKCLNECTEGCFFISSELKPIIVEPWDSKDEEDGLPEKSLVRTTAFFKERELKPRFAELNTIEHTIGLKWKELELQEKQLLEEVKKRMQYATEQVQIEIDQMYLEHQSQMLREELLRRQEDLRRIDELRSQDLDRRRSMVSMRRHDAYGDPFGVAGPVAGVFHQNQVAAAALQYNELQQAAYAAPTPLIQPQQQASAIDAAYTTNQVARGYGLPGAGVRGGDDYMQQQQQQQQQGYERKRPRY